MWFLTGSIGASLLVSALLVAGCSGGDKKANTGAAADLTVNLTNWAIVPSSQEVAAGRLKVAAVHPSDHGAHSSGGGAVHQLVIARLKQGAEDGEGAFDELLLNLTDIKMGDTKVGEVTLEPGEYELACLLVEESDGVSYNHYEEGMHSTLSVR